LASSLLTSSIKSVPSWINLSNPDDEEAVWACFLKAERNQEIKADIITSCYTHIIQIKQWSKKRFTLKHQNFKLD
jgi:hypothetical protein